MRHLLRGPAGVHAILLAVFLAMILASAASVGAESLQTGDSGKKPPTVINPPPTAKDWADLARLPDWSGV